MARATILHVPRTFRSRLSRCLPPKPLCRWGAQRYPEARWEGAGVWGPSVSCHPPCVLGARPPPSQSLRANSGKSVAFSLIYKTTPGPPPWPRSSTSLTILQIAIQSGPHGASYCTRQDSRHQSSVTDEDIYRYSWKMYTYESGEPFP